jgi:hypothetical protein
MEKEVRRFKVDYLLDWEYGVEISKLRADLDAIEALGATHVEIESGIRYYDYPYVTIEPISEHLETDEEFKSRVEEVEKKQCEIKRIELEQLEKLKSKYGI